MELSERVLELLRGRKEPLSGEEMAARLQVSRNSVWKAVQKLRSAGYTIQAGTNSGYQLVAESGVFSPANIARRLTGPACGADIRILEEVTSTNTVGKELAEQGSPEGTVIIALRQTAGKGRLGRSFASPAGTGLYMSILLRPRFSAEESLSITTAAAVAVAGAVEAAAGKKAMIKWVNDVYLDGYKICGILTEASIDFETGGLRYAVLGIGVNVEVPEGGFPEELRDIAGALYEKDAPPETRTVLAAEILNRFFGFYQTLTDRPFLPEYRRRSLLTGRRVTLVRGSIKQIGTVLGVDDEARLLVRLENGEEAAFSAGEVTVEKDFLESLRKGSVETREECDKE
ncbi:MAG: biotin--[acetyl-CoA-carboxylase] ligase [Acutalibacter sp.]|nr:biotin--[acetyl-CoA-carboxylase] ligase [Acutalibacter sp.]